MNCTKCDNAIKHASTKFCPNCGTVLVRNDLPGLAHYLGKQAQSVRTRMETVESEHWRPHWWTYSRTEAEPKTPEALEKARAAELTRLAKLSARWESWLAALNNVIGEVQP